MKPTTLCAAVCMVCAPWGLGTQTVTGSIRCCRRVRLILALCEMSYVGLVYCQGCCGVHEYYCFEKGQPQDPAYSTMQEPCWSHAIAYRGDCVEGVTPCELQGHAAVFTVCRTWTLPYMASTCPVNIPATPNAQNDGGRRSSWQPIQHPDRCGCCPAAIGFSDAVLTLHINI